jgi:protease-4
VSELRDAIIAFRQSGKRAVAFSESFGELSPGTGGYALATAFDEIWLQPAGGVSLSPLSAEGVFARDAFDKVGVQPQLTARKEFKNAPNTFTEQAFTGPHREATMALLTSAQQTVIQMLRVSRPSLGDDDAVEKLLTGGPYTDLESERLGLIDHLGYRDDAIAAAKGAAGADDDDKAPSLLWLRRYIERSDKAPEQGGAVVAVVSAVGQIHRGASNVDPLTGSQGAGADTVGAALRAAIDDEDVRAIILRIDSPGGSVVASETIAHEVKRAKDKGKPVVASMANVAGSGGYYIAMNANRIIAQPGTITGSIGVYAGKMVTSDAFAKVGVNFETVVVDDADASFFSTSQPYSEAASAKLEAMVDGIYTSFVGAVAKGRGKSFDEIEPVARGRIWSGADALERGLVDGLGGWTETRAAVRELLSLPADAPLRLKDFPEEKPPLQQLLAHLGPAPGDSSEDATAATVSTHRPQLDVRALRALLRPEAAMMLMPSVEVLP